MDEGQTSV